MSVVSLVPNPFMASCNAYAKKAGMLMAVITVTGTEQVYNSIRYATKKEEEMKLAGKK